MDDVPAYETQSSRVQTRLISMDDFYNPKDFQTS